MTSVITLLQVAAAAYVIWLLWHDYIGKDEQTTRKP